MKTILFLSVSTIVLGMVLKFAITPHYGEDVKKRFIERLSYIPSQNSAPLNVQSLGNWLSDSANRSTVNGYVFPVLFPLDILFLACLGTSIGMASAAIAGQMSVASGIPSWVWWLFPALYMTTDLAEDTLLALLFKSAVALTDESFTLLRSLTKVKIATVGVASAQVGLLALVWLVLKLFPSAGGLR
jgi:hypothetical protein